ncbi:DUF4422 domain-containing protein [Ruegeria sp. R14_0]|uniref:DUF4422 domain-containing protein n=1 Tax=Ruegeria sp. R14_0 TaxID=2821100 RepID=UPI001ADCE7D8|nr:DUF4422 domain-containing protein [Ruegeria sp. R14_0]MBO9445971.1 DUF4422 domain-containing protein [Ruegeria sp. R14_0]
MIKTDVFVGVCYHKTAPVIKTEVLRPIQVGAALTDQVLDFALQDNTGNNISHKNKQWCELTAAYWMRHNVDAQYYGLMHYRRLLAVSPKIKSDRSFVSAGAKDYQKFGWNDQLIRDEMSKTDILTPPTYSIYPVGLPDCIMTNYNMYARDHFIRDLDACIDASRNADQQVFPYLLQTLKDTKTRFGNIFVMKRDLFFEYTDWMFGILEETERKLDTARYDPYQARVIGFLAERLTEAYFRYAASVHGSNITEKRLVFLAKRPQPARLTQALSEAKTCVEHKKRSNEASLTPINVAFAIDEGYAEHAAASLHSVLLSAVQSERYHSYFFHKGDLSKTSRQWLQDIADRYCANVSFIKVPVDDLRWLPMNRPHISLTTYYRLVMHKYLPDNVHRIIYLDADTLAIKPLEELWDVNLDGCIIAAAPDEGGAAQNRRLKLSTKHKYFNAGVLVLNVEQLRVFDLKTQVLRAFEDRGEFITLQDQDLLNIIFENSAAPLDLKWNVNNRIFVKNELDPAYSDDQAAAAAKQPGILHFTDSKKPWHNTCYNPFYELYWFHRSSTPWAESRPAKFKRVLKRSLWCRLNKRYRQNLSDAQDVPAQR